MMTVLRHEMSVSLTLESPFITRGMVVDRASIDMPLALNAENKEILPATLVKGVVRGALECLGDKVSGLQAEIDALLGSESQKREGKTRKDWRVSNDPERGVLLFEDLVIDETGLRRMPAARASYARIRVDEKTGSVQEGYLAFVGMPFPIGTPVTFRGILRLLPCDKGPDPDRVRQLIDAALQLVPAIGAMKSVGFGKVVGSKVGEMVPVMLGTSRHVDRVLKVTYEADRPIAVGGAMKSDNLFSGDKVIPGGAIKGCIARNLQCANLLGEETSKLLAAMTVGHAFPVLGDDMLPLRYLPLSLAVASMGNAGTYVADHLGRSASNDLTINDEAARWAFARDWKHKDAWYIGEKFKNKWNKLDCDVRTRTAIDSHRGSAAYDFKAKAGQVFSVAAVKNKGVRWTGRLLFPDGIDAAAQMKIVALLEQGIVGLGKTGARLWITSAEPYCDEKDKRERLRTNGPFALTLQTPAVLNDVERLSKGEPLKCDYEAYWNGLGYRLVDYFATQHLEGGYIALRYPPRCDRVEPWLLTDPGSVFLVEPDKSEFAVEDLLLRGLPPASWLSDRTWEDFPFECQNGYGEVMLNAIDHRAFKNPVRVEP
ncbi:MAG: hypothetical protein H6851_13240 [Geminicoccaceae bacterium]|nr:hypothetical protein [Geminicoccaceae bacterium]